MRSERSRRKFGITWWWSRRILCACSLTVAVAGDLRAQQDEAVVEAIAGVLAAQDARSYNGAFLAGAARHPDPAVRRQTALALGRIGHRASAPLLLDLLSDPDMAARANAAFALGLLADPATIPRLRDFVLNSPAGESEDAHAEAIGALTRIGGAAAGQVVGELLGRWAGAAAGSGQLPMAVLRALGDAWRLGEDAPVQALTAFASAPLADARRAAVYSLARLRAGDAADILLAATDDSAAEVRATAVRELTVSFADAAGLDRGGLAGRVRRLTGDPDPRVRINALRALGSYGTEDLAGVAIDRATDPDHGVRLQALVALGQLGGDRAAAALAERVADGPFGARRQALLSLALTDGVSALERLRPWLSDSDWRYRAAAAEAAGLVGGDTAAAWLEGLILDRDPRVVAVGLNALIEADSAAAAGRARDLLEQPDPVVRLTAAGHLGRGASLEDVGRLIAAFERAQGDAIPDARLAVLDALSRISEGHPDERAAIAEQLLARVPRSDDHLVRRLAADQLPRVAARWGPATPVATGRGAGDYRDIARRLVLPAERGAGGPMLTIETDRGDLTVTLYPADAPVSVDAILRLAARNFFDGSFWNRVVPNVVVQGGDPRGDGWGGPGFTLRDEPSRRRYLPGTVGLALSGPDTAGSQFFAVLSPQPHLEGGYTVIGQITAGLSVLDGVTQGDRIRRLRSRP